MNPSKEVVGTELWRLTATEIASRVNAGKLKAVDVVASSLERLRAVNPRVNAVIVTCAEALKDAAEVDERVARTGFGGRLAGVPVTIKAGADQKGYLTDSGAKHFAQTAAETDSPQVKSLKDAGAVVIGRTNMPAFGCRWFSRSSLHGLTRNPVNPKITSGGSSGGAAAAVAVGIGPVAHGTDIAGSIRFPAYACGIHGIRPSLGRVGQFNDSSGDRQIGGQLMAVSGPLARSIPDLREAYEVMCAPDCRDSQQVQVPLRPASVCAKEGKPLRVGVWACPQIGGEYDTEVVDAVRQAAEKLRAAGHEVSDCDGSVPQEADLHAVAHSAAVLWASEYEGVDQRLKHTVDRTGDPDAIFAVSGLLRMSGVAASEWGCANFGQALMRALTERSKGIRQWGCFFQSFDVLLCPVSSRLAFRECEDVESEEAFDAVWKAQALQRMFPALAVPAIAVSTGTVRRRLTTASSGLAGGELEGGSVSEEFWEDVPVGVQLVAERFHEEFLFRAGEDLIRGTEKEVVTPVNSHG
uniref:Amidase domain-containing protein n=1 Tax=Chromera velia CCMP2878 TaxID=1169474 RepID=A0A0G4F147_9ALVE|mmetsp:Transcript_54040/g.105710  ORF Transcript_54040/g.105710 Transcript_54040/m.105710 type:complete len:524 (+) Transcript_54040:91-1662(+)|eukprot:Cvel_14662.t1-p1 / transcript=Cvel_14662.t1 / gene=Cvel_14662 / organism=Chromera_velia_CCMP2878 / gene_product=Indoleacetamide hydrolase, putative / transcript_product=Indoleacetamide hydrolase, putative / location=Cvel_scaffold1051:10628-13144(-) / protein_length=523 / sequence_SO=supercontig / SO=protein_coding / is_pseudo=false